MLQTVTIFLVLELLLFLFRFSHVSPYTPILHTR